MNQALKDDKAKLRYDLVPAVELEGMVKILTFGSVKYGPNNWQEADAEFVQRVIAANMRHEAEIRKGHLYDEESGELHAYHMMCNSLFLAWYANNRPELFPQKNSITANYAGSHHSDHVNTRHISSEELDLWIRLLVEDLQVQFEARSFDCVLYIPQGGVVPAVKVAELLNLPVFSINDKVDRRVYKRPLVVDDINDTGKTLNTLAVSDAVYATVVKRHSSECNFAWYGHLEKSDDYLIFPWEHENVENN